MNAERRVLTAPLREERRMHHGWTMKIALVTLLAALAFARPAAAQPVEEPWDFDALAEWVCYPAFESAGRQGTGPCGCAFPGACDDRAPAGCYCDSRCADEGDCCPDAGVCAVVGGLDALR